MFAIAFQFLIGLAVLKNLDMRLMDMVTTHLSRSLDMDMYVKIPEGFKMLASCIQ